LTTVRSIRDTSLGERWSEDIDGVVTTGENEVSDKLFISVDDKVSSKRRGFLSVLDEVSRR
jgi:hypothetical protein